MLYKEMEKTGNNILKNEENIGDFSINTKNDIKETIEQENPNITTIKTLGGVLFNTNDGLSNFCFYTDHTSDCSDGSNLYTLIKIDGKDVIIKLGAGEFNTEVFNQKDINKHNKYNSNSFKNYKYIKGFSKTPIPLFVVNQIDSHFANDDQNDLKKTNPKKYLQEYSVIVVPKRKQAYINQEHNENFQNINIENHDTIIKKLKTAILETNFSKKRFQDIKKNIKNLKDLTETKRQSQWNFYHQKNKNNTLIELFKSMITTKEEIINLEILKKKDLKKRKTYWIERGPEFFKLIESFEIN